MGEGSKKVIIPIVIVLLIILILGGRQVAKLVSKDASEISKMSKKELVSLAEGQLVELDDLYVKLEETEQMLKGIQDEEVPTAAISSIGDGTGRLTFNSFQDKIRFTVPFEYPESTQIANTASVNITQGLSISTTPNWSMRTKGTELELEHSSGISGVIKAGQINDVVDRQVLKDEVFPKFFSKLPPDTIRYSKLFLDENWWGLQAMTNTFIDSKEAYLRAGMVGLGEQCFTYVFVYKGKEDAEKNEKILSLLNTVKMFGQELRVEE